MVQDGIHLEHTETIGRNMIRLVYLEQQDDESVQTRINSDVGALKGSKLHKKKYTITIRGGAV